MRRIAVGIGVVALSFALVGSFAVGVGAAESNGGETNASFGAEISSFMQASDTETTAEIDDGTFDIAMNRSTDPEQRRALIENRTDRLEERNRELRAQRDEIGEERSVRSHAVATRVAVGASGLERAANRTERAARETGTDLGRIGALRSSARELHGPDIVGLTPGVAGPPGENVRGPPDAGPGGNRSMGEQSGAPNPTANRSGVAEGNGSEDPPDAGDSGERSGSSGESDDRGGSGPPDGVGGADRSDGSDSERSDSDSNGGGGDGESFGPPPSDESGPPDRSDGGIHRAMTDPMAKTAKTRTKPAITARMRPQAVIEAIEDGNVPSRYPFSFSDPTDVRWTPRHS